MSKEQLIKQLNTFLDESPFDDSEVSFWKEKMLKMNNTELEELFGLLKEKLKIITNANDLFVKIAEDAVEEKNKRQAVIPAKASIVDMSIDDVVVIFKNKILDLLKDDHLDIFNQLNQFFNNAKLAGAKVVEEFDMLIKALHKNNNIFTRKYKGLNTMTVGGWLNLYNRFNDKSGRKSIDRISFVNNDENAKKLDKERKNILLKLLKLYDFLLNPANAEHEILEPKITTKVRTIAGPPKTQSEKKIDELKQEEKQYVKGGLEEKALEEEISNEKRIEELRYMADKYPEGSLERKAVRDEIEKLRN